MWTVATVQLARRAPVASATENPLSSIFDKPRLLLRSWAVHPTSLRSRKDNLAFRRSSHLSSGSPSSRCAAQCPVRTLYQNLRRYLLKMQRRIPPRKTQPDPRPAGVARPLVLCHDMPKRAISHFVDSIILVHLSYIFSCGHRGTDDVEFPSHFIHFTLHSSWVLARFCGPFNSFIQRSTTTTFSPFWVLAVTKDGHYLVYPHATCILVLRSGLAIFVTSFTLLYFHLHTYCL